MYSIVIQYFQRLYYIYCYYKISAIFLILNSQFLKGTKDLDKHLTKGDAQMANKHIKKYSVSHIMRELHIKTMRHHCSPIIIIALQNADSTKCWWGSRSTGTEVKWSESRSVMSDSLQPHGLYSPLNSPAQNNGVGSLSLLQGIFLTQGSNPGLPHCRWILYQLSHKGSPQEHAFIAGGNAKWYNHFAKQFGIFLQNQIYAYLMTQQSYSLIFNQMNWKCMPICTKILPQLICNFWDLRATKMLFSW